MKKNEIEVKSYVGLLREEKKWRLKNIKKDLKNKDIILLKSEIEYRKGLIEGLNMAIKLLTTKPIIKKDGNILIK
jgi:hypothetical protein